MKQLVTWFVVVVATKTMKKQDRPSRARKMAQSSSAISNNSNDSPIRGTNTTSSSTSSNHKISARDFYSEFRGHRVEHLDQLLSHVLRDDENENIHIIWTAGDSSLDNKYWFHDTVPTVPSYQSILQPPRSKPDVTYWLNHLLSSSTTGLTNSSNNEQSSSQQQQQRRRSSDTGPTANTRYIAINGAIEASTLNTRSYRLRPQDEFVRDHMQPNDVLIVSVGGNDVALVPQPCTIVSIVCLLLILPSICMERGCVCGTVSVDDYCCGCGPSLCSCLCACPPCLGYFRHLFGLRMQRYIEALTEKTKPSKILVCMIYFPDETPDAASWADPTLRLLGYNTNPQKLQTFIRKVYHDVISTIQIPGSQVIPVPLYRVLNGKNSEDYVARVEPSPTGGRKMAEFLLAYIFSSPITSNHRTDPIDMTRLSQLNQVTPSSSLIQERE
jgi:hypothetical protein